MKIEASGMKSVKELLDPAQSSKAMLGFVPKRGIAGCRTVNLGSGAIEKYHKLSPFPPELAISLTAKISSWLCEAAEAQQEALARF